ncbi:MATE family efflux transporter [Aureliella helgolandensis]|uniref:Multidrug-efflux transporter n=1 Tax=Aureliella helgolandensis TaxID=2527968 RepID=A0A518G0C4_9BACT|nr:MATE family efflux transporter [Aureliella helgolandensis]QDV21974.1 Multidrug resistance protein MdtK [Aureliella helgolandensis]
MTTDVSPVSQFNRFAAWWSSEWGPGPIISLALPLMLSAGFVSVTLFTDRTLLYWQSEAAASAAMGAGTLYWTFICLPMGLLGYLSTFVSQYRGAKQFLRIGAVYQHAQAIAWAIVPLLLLAMALSDQIFRWAGHSPELVKLESTYLRLLLIGGIGVLFYSVQSGLLTGQGRTKTVLAIDGIASIINLILDFVLIFGWGPIPELGIVGAAIATTFSFWLKIPLASWSIARDKNQGNTCHLGRRSPWEWDLFRRLIVYGGPAGLQMLAEAACFSVIMLQVGRLGELHMAATTLALGLNILVFVPMIGLGIGVGVLVGQHLTSGRVDLARRTVTCALGVTTIYSVSFAALLGLAPDFMISFYAWGTPPERFEQMLPLLKPLLAIIAVYCVLDGWQVVFVGAIKGAGDTWFVLLATICVSSAAVVVGLTIQAAYGASLMLWWYVIAGWVSSMGAVFATRYVRGAWTTKRVIESES